jgi:hypothetical protein
LPGNRSAGLRGPSLVACRLMTSNGRSTPRLLRPDPLTALLHLGNVTLAQPTTPKSPFGKGKYFEQGTKRASMRTDKRWSAK